MSPDPYDSSYDDSDPQSLNRYGYLSGNPLAFVDALGLVRPCDGSPADTDGPCDSGGGGGISICTYFPMYCGIGLFGFPPPNQLPPVPTGGGGKPKPIPTKAPNNINCNTVLPNGKTVGAYVAAARNALNSVPGTGSPLLDAYHMLTTFKALVGGGSAIDFKNTMSGQASQEFLGNAGNLHTMQ